jgi:hypothetical protein
MLMLRWSPSTSHADGRDAKVSKDSSLASSRTFRELPEWAPPQAYSVSDRFAPTEPDHYESWQGIYW